MTSSIQKFRYYADKILSLEKSQVQLEKEAPLSIALVFPNSYEVAMANLGFQTLYRLLNSCSGVRCERAFFHKSFPNLIRTLESGLQLSHFDVIAFSISFELDYLNLIKILRSTGLDLFAKDRHPRDPIIIAGGVATFINPEPIAPFFDLFVIGEVESAIDILIEHLMMMKHSSKSKDDITKQLAEVDGIYIPQLHTPTKKLIKIFTTIKDATPQYSSVITSKSHFKNMFLIEVGRGCGRYCRFCAASHVYHPVRFFTLENILKTIEENIHSTSKVGLVGAALCDYPKLNKLCKVLLEKKYQLGFSSFRFDSISDSFLDIIQQAGIKTITLAPEAGTVRLRKIINKPISDERIMAAIKLIAKSEITNLKLYFLVGLPFEEQQDILGIIELVKQIREMFFTNAKQKRELTISVNAFVPKPFTPFQWCAMDVEKNLKIKWHQIEIELRKIPGIKLNRKSIRAEVLQGMLSFGDRKIAKFLSSFSSLKTIPNLFSTSLHSNLIKEKFFDEPFPWDFITYPVKKERLWREWQKSKELA